MPANQTAWNSNNQGDKETFIQTWRRGQRQATRLAERTHGKGADHTGKEGLAHWETKDSKVLAVKYCRGYDMGETLSLTVEFVGKGG